MEKNIKYPKYLKVKLPESILNQNDISSIKKYSNNFESNFYKISIKDLENSLLSMGMEKNSISFKNILKAVNEKIKIPMNENNENDIPLENLEEIFEENLGYNDSKEEIRKIFEILIKDPNQNNINIDDMMDLLDKLDWNYDENELIKQISNCCEVSKNFSFEDFYILMSSGKKKEINKIY